MIHSPLTCRNRQRGLTLTEILVAMAIFMIGSVGIMALFAAAGQRSAQAEDRLQAALLLDSVCDDLDVAYNTRYALPRQQQAGHPQAYLTANGGVAPPNPLVAITPADWPQPPSVRYNYTIYLEPLPNAPGAVLATVTIYYGRGGNMNTLVYEKVILTN